MQRCNYISVKVWDAYLHDVMSDPQTRSVNAHLLTCSECNRTLNALETENALIGIGLRAVPLQRMSIPARDLVAMYTTEKIPAVEKLMECPTWRDRITALVTTMRKKKA
jgi:hypothetical protein